MSRHTRPIGLAVFVTMAFVTLGKAPGAVQLRTREVETFILAEGKTGRDLKARSGWIDRAP